MRLSSYDVRLGSRIVRLGYRSTRLGSRHTAGSSILLAGKIRLRVVFPFRTCTMSDVTQLLNNGLLKGSSTSSRTLSRHGRTCSREGTAGRHIGLILTLHYQNLHSGCFGVPTSDSSSKSPSPAWEEISEAEVETGLAKIHASTWGHATVQCCFPRCSARALASIKDRLSLAHCFRVQPSQVVQGFLGSTLQSPAATRHWGQEAWLS